MRRSWGIILLGVAGAAGCSQGDDLVEQAGVESVQSALSLKSVVPINDTDVKFVRFTIIPADCSTGAPIGPPRERVELLEDQAIPGNIANLQNAPLDENSKHLFADTFEVLPAGCYNVSTTPLRPNHSPSAVCSGAAKKSVPVIEGKTTEIFLINQCKGHDPGALDIISVLNREPVIQDVEFPDSKFACGSPATVCALASDPDGDPLEMSLTTTASCDIKSVRGPAGSPLRGVVQCWQVHCPAPGKVDLKLQVYDQVWKADKLVRIEDWLAAEGYPNESHAKLDFHAYVDGITFYPDVDGDGHGDPKGPTQLRCNLSDQPPGHVTSSDDCDDNDPYNYPGNDEICDGRDNNCNGYADERLLCPIDNWSIKAKGAGLTSAGAAMASRGGQSNDQNKILVDGIPAGARVFKAVLYWMVIGKPDDSMKLDGHPVSGTKIRQLDDTCWGYTGNVVYGADITATVTAKRNAVYNISGYPQDPAGGGPTDGQGASIFVAYGDPTDGKINLVTLKAGLGVINEIAEVMTSSFTGLSVGAGFSSAVLHNAVGDGQNAGDRLLFKGTVIEGNNAFPGAEGHFWDNRIDDVTALVAAGDTTLTSQIDINPGNDCLAWGVNALQVSGYQP